jgi:hypothetical protein
MDTAYKQALVAVQSHSLRLLSRLLAVVLMALCLASGCKCNTEAATVPPRTPTIRLYAISSLAGAIEPCGCVKDMLGGVDHAAAFVRSQAEQAPESLVLGAGPMFFMNVEPDPKRDAQDQFKADALAAALRDVGLSAWAPGANDWAGGGGRFQELASKAGAAALAANLSGPHAGTEPTRVFDVGRIKVGVAGVSEPAVKGKYPDGVSAVDARAAAEKARLTLTAQGAKLRVLLAALPRGQALRLAEAVPGFHVVIAGKPFDQGESNDPPNPPELIGKTLVVELPNHLQSVGVIDFFVRNDSYDFADGSGIADQRERQSLESRVAELRRRIAENSAANKEDLAARQRELAGLERELSAMRVSGVPERGSFFMYKEVEIREKLGSDPRVASRLAEFYRQVNDHNREAFKDWTPEPAADGQSGYIGIERCSTCHQEERAFWNRTAHASAYSTLVRQHKEFNLECTSCHVTGYAKPGGSTVTHVDGLRDVQCEVCHGPGSRHATNPGDASLIVRTPARTACVECHHPPHVKADWSVDESWKKIIGPGHGG